MDCLDCGNHMEARMFKNETDPAFFNGPASDVRTVYICRNCSDDYHRTWPRNSDK